MKFSLILQCILIVLYFLVTITGYALMPAIVTTHWGAQGQPNGFMSREMHVLFMSGLLIFVYTILKFSIRAEPNQKNVEKFIEAYEWFLTFLVFFLLSINIAVTLWNIGYKINIFYFIVPLLSALFIVIAYLFTKTERNNSVGIRTPWTLSDDEIWKKTHLLGASLFRVLAGITLLGLLFVNYAIYFMIVPMFLTVSVLFFYSYLLYANKQKSNS